MSSQIELGMNRTQVVELLGPPNYSISELIPEGYNNYIDYYYVRDLVELGLLPNIKFFSKNNDIVNQKTFLKNQEFFGKERILKIHYIEENNNYLVIKTDIDISK